jgi:YidC/Oxa1 family membrane protein insertase
MSSSWTRVLLAVVLSAGILFLWQYFSPRPKPPTGGTATETGTGTGTGADQAKTGVAPPASAPAKGAKKGAVAAESEGPVAESIEGKKTKLQAKGAVAEFTTTGGALRSWKLTDERFKERRGSKLVPVDLVQTRAGKGPWPLSMTFLDSDFAVPEYAAFAKVRESAREVVYSWESDKVRLVKHYVIDKVRPVVWLTLRVRNRTTSRLKHRLQVNLYAQQDPGQGKASFTNPYPMISTVLCHVNGELQRRSAGAIKGEDSGCSAAGCGMGEGPVTQTGQVRWVGSDNRYFITAVVALDKQEERRCELQLKKDDVVHAALQFPEATIPANGVVQRRFAVFVGAKDLGSLDAIKGPDDDTKLADSIEFGWFAVLCRPMLWLLKVFYRMFGNWGVAIILLTVVVKLLTLYWTQKSMRSMKQMQRLKPKIDELRAKFKDDKERLNQEMMALYKIHKVNPLGGCLPMLIQMPIWFALYRTLGNAVELYRSNFAGWITDLTAPDPYYVLPIAMGISMYAQQAITPQPMEGTQAKMMKYFMPGFFTLMMLALPSGLTLYIFVNTVLTMIHQWYMNKTEPAEPVAKSPPAKATVEGSNSSDAGQRGGQRPRRRKKRKGRG